MQYITLNGRISADAEIRQAGSSDVTTFNLAVDQGWGDKKVTNWFRIQIWGKKGSGMQPYLLKGSQVTVVGELEIGEYNGKPQYQVNATGCTFPPKPRQDGGNQSRGGGSMQGSGFDDQRGRASSRSSFDDDLDDSIPFLSATGIY